MIESILFESKHYPKFQAEGFAARFAFPFAEQVCKGRGYDIGCNREEWKFPGAIPIDPLMSGIFNAMNLPVGLVDYIFSSHCLEHLDKWVDVLDYWFNHLEPGGVLFLYLPHPDQEYWHPWNNRKHVNLFTPEIIELYLKSKFCKVFVSERDLNHSFMAMAQKPIDHSL